MMRLLLKLFAAPLALALTLATALCSLALSVSGIVFGIASSAGFIVSVALLVTGQTAGGIAWMAVALLVGAVPAFGAWIVRGLDGAGGVLKAFIFS